MDYANLLLEKGGYANLTAEERAFVDAEALNQLRKIRNGLLAETDKYMTPDYPITDEQRSNLQTYRQELRDLTLTNSPMFEDDGGPILQNVNFPTNEFVTDDIFYKYAPMKVT